MRSSIFRIGAGLLGWSGLLLQWALVVRNRPDDGPISATIWLLGFFTIWTNIIAAAALTVPWLAPRSRAMSWLMRPMIRGGIATAIVVVFATYHLVLAKLWAPQGMQFVADLILHTLMPIVFVMDFLLFVQHGRIRAPDVLRWLVYPLVYSIVGLSRGLLTQEFPYPFLDTLQLGWTRVGINMIAMLCAFVLVGALIWLADRYIGSRRKSD